MPLDLITAALAGDIGWAMNAFAASGSLLLDQLPLYFARQRTHHVQARIGQHVGEEHRNLGFALDDSLDHLRGPRLRLGLGLHLLGMPRRS
jgi:hypothetical protein